MPDPLAFDRRSPIPTVALALRTSNRER